ncbi:hypothetical protein ACHAPD_005805 [Fusarium lateritium]
MDIPPRPGTPAVRNTSEMDPLQRWVDSPPEDEPAAVTAIARAVASVKPSSAKPLLGSMVYSVADPLGAEDEHTRKNEDLWQQHTKHSNVHFAQRHFEQSTTGNDTKTHYIYHSSDGSAVPKDHVVKKMTALKHVVFFVDTLIQTMLTSKGITTQHAKTDQFKNARLIEKTI